MFGVLQKNMFLSEFSNTWTQHELTCSSALVWLRFRKFVLEPRWHFFVFKLQFQVEFRERVMRRLPDRFLPSSVPPKRPNVLPLLPETRKHLKRGALIASKRWLNPCLLLLIIYEYSVHCIHIHIIYSHDGPINQGFLTEMFGFNLNIPTWSTCSNWKSEPTKSCHACHGHLQTDSLRSVKTWIKFDVRSLKVLNS